MMMDKEKGIELGKAVRIFRAREDLSQVELAKKANVSMCSINFIENGCKKKPRVNTLIKIAKALNIKEEELLKYL